jgi:hypothetical protein
MLVSCTITNYCRLTAFVTYHAGIIIIIIIIIIFYELKSTIINMIKLLINYVY